MDIKENLPDKYFSNSVTDIEDSVDGRDIDYVIDSTIDFGEEYKMIGEESKAPASITASKPKTSKSISKDDNSNSSAKPTQEIINDDSKNNILNELKKIDDRLNELQQNTFYPDASEKQVFNNFSESDSTINVVDKNFFDTENVLQDKNSVTNYDKSNSDITNNKYGINSNEEKKILIKNEDLINKEISFLENRKEQLLNSLYYNSDILENLAQDIISDNNSTVSVDNFTPDIFNENKTDALTNSVNTENVFGNSPKIVMDDFGEPAIISKDQIDLKTAIQEHGGLEQGINDSINQQNFVSNFANDKDINNIFDKGESIFNDSFASSLENNYSELKTDNDLDLVKNTKNTVTAIEGLSKQFNALARAITTGFNSINGDIKEIKYNQNNNFNVSNSSQFSQSTTPSSRMEESSRENAYLPTEIRGNTPLGSHFPKGFDLNKLGSNLTNRI